MKKYFIKIFIFILLAFSMCCFSFSESEKDSNKLLGIGDLFPQDFELVTLKRAGEPRAFTKENLWDYIDGGAELYLWFGFQEVVTLEYQNQVNPDETFLVDIYHLQDAYNCFGIYAKEHSVELSEMSRDMFAHKENNIQYFAKGDYYIKIISFSESKDSKQEMDIISTFIVNKISGNNQIINEISKIPVIKDSRNCLSYTNDNPLQTRAFQCDYSGNDWKFTLLFVPASDSNDTRIIFDKLEEKNSESNSVQELSEPLKLFMEKWVKNFSVFNIKIFPRYGTIIQLKNNNGYFCIYNFTALDVIEKVLEPLKPSLKQESS